MLKWIAGILAVLLIGSFLYNFFLWGDAKEKIEDAKEELADYKEMYKTVIEKGENFEKVISGLRKVETIYQNRIDNLEKNIAKLNAENKEYQTRITHLFQPDELVKEMRRAFPELKTAPMGVARVPHPETGFPISTFQVPMEFVSTFISDHKEVEIFTKQLEAMGGINAVYKKYIVLQDSIIFLKEQKATAYKEGMEYGLNRYEDLMKEYISTLKNPPKIEWPSTASIIAAGAAGIVTGVLIKK